MPIPSIIKKPESWLQSYCYMFFCLSILSVPNTTHSWGLWCSWSYCLPSSATICCTPRCTEQGIEYTAPLMRFLLWSRQIVDRQLSLIIMHPGKGKKRREGKVRKPGRKLDARQRQPKGILTMDSGWQPGGRENQHGGKDSAAVRREGLHAWAMGSWSRGHAWQDPPGTYGKADSGHTCFAE